MHIQCNGKPNLRTIDDGSNQRQQRFRNKKGKQIVDQRKRGEKTKFLKSTCGQWRQEDRRSSFGTNWLFPLSHWPSSFKASKLNFQLRRVFTKLRPHPDVPNQRIRVSLTTRYLTSYPMRNKIKNCKTKYSVFVKEST